jgi:hypothetical protein
MAKIKLSALVSDIKGKMEGTVFARNGGGLYMRNNPIGVQKMTAKWGANKSRFASVVSSWRELTARQQAEWNEMAVNYTGHSIFGDNRKRSGYELYVKINQTMITSGLPAVLKPQMPVEFPDLGEPFGFMPNNDHIVNENFLFASGVGKSLGPASLDDSFATLSFNNQKKFIVSLRFLMGERAMQILEDELPIFLISRIPTQDQYLTVEIEKDNNQFKITTSVKDDTLEAEFDFIIEKEDLKEQNVLSMNFGLSELEDSYIIFNKKGYPVNQHNSNFTDPDDYGCVFVPFPTVQSNIAPVGIQFVNVGFGDYEPKHATLLQWGYQLEQIRHSFLFDPSFPDMFQRVGTGNISSQFKVPLVADRGEYFYTGYHDIFPYFAIKFLPFDDSQFRMVIKSTSLRSGGLTGATANFNIVGRYETDGNNKIEIGEDLEERLQYIARGGVIALQYQLMNIFTGQLSAPQTMNYLGLPEEIGIAPQAGCSEHSHCMPDETCSNGKCYPNNWECRDYAYLQMSPQTKRKPKFKPGSELATLVHK